MRHSPSKASWQTKKVRRMFRCTDTHALCNKRKYESWLIGRGGQGKFFDNATRPILKRMVFLFKSVWIFLIRNRDCFFLVYAGTLAKFCRENHIRVIAINYKRLGAMADKTCKRSDMVTIILICRTLDLKIHGNRFLKGIFSEKQFT